MSVDGRFILLACLLKQVATVIGAAVSGARDYEREAFHVSLGGFDQRARTQCTAHAVHLPSVHC